MPQDEEEDYAEQEIDASLDKAQEAEARQETLLETQLDLIATTMKPDTGRLTLGRIKDKDKADEVAKEFLDITKDLTLGNIEKEDRDDIDEYNDIIGYQLRKGYWRISLRDMRLVLTLLQTSRSVKGKNLELLFTKIARFEKILKKEQKGGLR